MLKLLIIILVLPGSFLFAQSNKIEIYLVKSNFPTQQGMQGYFMPRMEDLEPVPFIADADIKGYRVIKDTVLISRKYYEIADDTTTSAAHDSVWRAALFNKDTTTVSVVQNTHIIIVDSLSEMNRKLPSLPLREGIKFALVVNHKVIYGGYFWNYFSSNGCNWVCALYSRNEIRISRRLPDLWPNTKGDDPRQNDLLFTCLRKTKRLRN